MGKRGLAFSISLFLIAFYAVIVMYTLFFVLNIKTLENYPTALMFECIGIGLLAFFILGNILWKPMKIGYFVPLIAVTILYIICLNAINMALVSTLRRELFVLSNLGILFVYCLVSLPMYVMGKR